MEEKTFKLYELNTYSEPVERIVKESELTKSEKDLIYGDFIDRYNNLTDEMKLKFTHKLAKEYAEKYDEIALRRLDPRWDDLIRD